MKKILLAILVAALFPTLAHAWTVNWTPVTNYTDNTAIESASLPISYVVEFDNVAQPATTGTQWVTPSVSVGHGVSHSVRIKARTAQGVEGPYSPPFPWQSPEGILPPVSGISVRP